MTEHAVVPIRRSVRRAALAALCALDAVAVAVLVVARPGSTGGWWALAVLLVLLIAAADWALLRLMASRVVLDGQAIVLRYAFYPVVRIERVLVESVEVVESGGLFTPREGLSRSRRHLPVLMLAGGSRVPVPMCARIRPEAAEREAVGLRTLLGADQAW